MSTIVVLSLACQFSPPWGGATENGESGEIIFQDDFSDPTSGWNRAATPSGVSDYYDGAYRISVQEVYTDIWSMPGLYPGDVSIEVEAIRVGGERNNRFGIICRAQGDQFYTFVISSDGFYGIGKVKGVAYNLIGMDAMQPSEAINQGTALNHLRADCIGERLSLYVNGQRVAQVQDGEFTTGDVGLIAGTYDTPGVEILFDNFFVRSPP